MSTGQGYRLSYSHAITVEIIFCVICGHIDLYTKASGSHDKCNPNHISLIIVVASHRCIKLNVLMYSSAKTRLAAIDESGNCMNGQS